MTVTKTKVILHVPKTGGSSIRWPAMKVDGFRYSCQHCRFDCLPPKYKDMRKISWVRNPLNWYPSFFFFFKKEYQKIAARKRAMSDPFLDALLMAGIDSFNNVLPFLVNLNQFFDNPNLVSNFKKRIRYYQTNIYACWHSSYWDDIEDLNMEEYQNKSIYRWYMDTIGIQHCDKVYRLEDEYKSGMLIEFGDNVQFMHKNKTRNKPENFQLLASQKRMIEIHDEYIFERYY